MRRFWPHITRPLLEAHDCKVLVEIGAQYGEHTRLLAAFCKERGGKLVVVDPTPEFEHQPWVPEVQEVFTLHKEKSLQALPRLEGYDAVFIDGDHNWYTVFHELKAIENTAKRSGRFPLVFLHDTEWPYARRDLYYHPEDIPEAFRKPYANKGVFPGSPSLREKEGINQCQNNALEEGGERNGVLTAVQDFLKETSAPVSVMHVPGMHGLSIIGPKEVIDGSPVLQPLRLEGTVREHVAALEEDRTAWCVRATEEQMNGLRNAFLMKQYVDTVDRLEHQLQEHEQRHAAAAAEWAKQLEAHHRVVRSRSWRYTVRFYKAASLWCKAPG
jgi:hypothetical protein